MNRKAAMTVVPVDNAPASVGPFVMYPMRGQGAPARNAATLGDYLDAIYRRRWWVLSAVIAAVSLTYLVSKQLPRQYEATATLDVDRASPSSLVGPDNGTQVAPDMDQFLATHLRMLQSDTVLRPVAEKFHLLENTPAQKQAAGGPTRLPALKVNRPPNTYLIQITYRSADPQTSASVANWIAKSYIDHLRSLREGEWSKLAGTTNQQLIALKQKMESSNQALLEFQRKIGMVDPEDKTNVLTARLLQLNMDYARAQSDRAAKEAAYQTLRGGSPEAAEASTQAEQLKRLIERKSEAQQRFADVKAVYGESHSEYQRADAQLRDVDGQLKAAYRNAVKRSESELQEVRLREANLSEMYMKTKAEADTLAARAVEYRLLRQRADADRSLFDELSRKVGEAAINSGLRTTPVRIADTARPDPRPASPNTPLNCAVALLGSLIAGCVAAIVHDTRNIRFRTAEELRAASGVPMTVALPAVKAWRGRQGFAMFSGEVNDGKPGDTDIPKFREKIRMLRNEFAEHAGPQHVRVIAVVSPGAGEGRSRVAAELASAYAALEQKTLLVDANLRSPVLHGLQLATSPRTGLCSALSGETRWRDGVMYASTPKSPDVLPSGAPDSRSCDLLHRRLAWLLEEASGDYDVLVLDSPPFLRFSEGLDIVRSADLVIAVARAGVTHPREFEAMMRFLRRLNAPIAAAVLNGAGN